MKHIQKNDEIQLDFRGHFPHPNCIFTVVIECALVSGQLYQKSFLQLKTRFYMYTGCRLSAQTIFACDNRDLISQQHIS